MLLRESRCVAGKTLVHVYLQCGLPIALLLASSASAGLPVENERLRWHFEFQSAFSGAFQATADDGTIYATDNLDLYAVNPDGSMQWSLPGGGGGRPIDVGADGTIYTARADVIAVSPEGVQQWSFPRTGSFLAGPTVGPDGNIYAATNLSNGGVGAFSITTAPALRWTNAGDPEMSALVGNNSRVPFAGDIGLYSVSIVAAGGASVWGIDVDGNQDWFGSDSSPPIIGKPVTDSMDRVISVFGNEVIASASDGSLIWEATAPGDVEALLSPVVDSNDVIYTADTTGGDRWALNPDGTTRYFQPDSGKTINKLGVAPDGQTLLLAGNEFGDPGFVAAYDANGLPKWQVTLDPRGGLNEFVHSNEFTYSPDGGTAYFTVRVGANGGNGRLYALALGELLAADLNHDGCVDNQDLGVLLAAYLTCNGDGNFNADADLTGDGCINNEDLGELLAVYLMCE